MLKINWFRRVVVITSALHAEGREFDPRRNLYSLFFFQKTHFNWNLWSQRDWCYFFVRFLIRWQASQTTTFEMHENAPLVCWMMLQLIGTRRATQCGQMSTYAIISMPTTASAHSSRLAQSVEHETLNLGVVGSSPTLGVFFFIFHFYFCLYFLSFLLLSNTRSCFFFVTKHKVQQSQITIHLNMRKLKTLLIQ